MTNKALIRAAAFSLLFTLVLGFAPLALADGENTFSDPENFTEWQVLGPSGGDVRAVTIDPRDKDRLYISTIDGQIHTSGDGGRTWSLLVNLNEPGMVLDQLMVDLRDSKTIYTSGHKNNMAGGFFRSTDGGVTWKESKDLSSEAIHAMTQSKDDPNILYVGAATGVWMSKNSGEDWQRIESTSMPRNVNSMAVDPRNTSTIYAGTVWRPYKSTDSGKSWRLIKDGMIDDSDVFAMTVDPRNADHIIASACSGIYESFSGGSKWAKIQGIPSQSRRTRDIVQHPSVAGTIYAGTTEGFWMSTNGGKSWAMTTPRTLEINSIAVHPEAPNRVFIGTNNYGVMVSNDGGRNFTPTNDNFTSRFTYSITPDLTQPNRLYATTQNTATSGGFFFTSNDGGRTWVQAKSLDVVRTSPFSVLQDRTDPNKIYLGTNVGIYISTDRGVTWTLIAPPKSKKPARKVPAKKGAATAKKAAPAPAPAVTAAGPTVVPVLTEKVRVLAFTEDGKNGILAGTDSGLYRTYDIAKGWEKLPFGEGVSPSVFVIHASSLIPGTIYVGTATSGVLVSNDDGKTWEKTNGAPDGIPVSSIAVDAKRPNYIYVGTIQSLYLSRDGGRTWQRRGGNLPLGNYTSILIDPKNNDQIFVSSALESDGGIFYSDDAGARWKKVNTKKMRLPSHRVWSMAFDPNDPDRIFAGSHSSGVYRIERQHQADAAGTKRREDTQAAN
jgi:photosystem II stability/assembly factor-like uncharacterized protein